MSHDPKLGLTSAAPFNPSNISTIVSDSDSLTTESATVNSAKFNSLSPSKSNFIRRFALFVTSFLMSVIFRQNCLENCPFGKLSRKLYSMFPNDSDGFEMIFR